MVSRADRMDATLQIFHYPTNVCILPSTRVDPTASQDTCLSLRRLWCPGSAQIHVCQLHYWIGLRVPASTVITPYPKGHL